jgi:hypothetical protein
LLNLRFIDVMWVWYCLQITGVFHADSYLAGEQWKGLWKFEAQKIQADVSVFGPSFSCSSP